ncbi:Transcriptional regulator, LacI family [Rubellimicrobium mesophilum DSM 19309]|uniref:Transcriptional regulator, LacI family n=1 Tax=Rubellimicrobium mesophilum DSM 19309 TaxID=442562 RepID=A0A017HM35_9RHOB|nr:LacI family DNA-binding transcriptional regulator [Rubellimicrobium mesophilum]EYD75228.1 Transcriptional regulator, LacI family [Rubellimicrobium mesophilum DSM 19309]
MKRPTIADLARAAGVSVPTVNRILGGSASVRPATIQRVRDAAEEIGFYGLGAIDARRKEAKPRYRLAFLLQQSSRELYQLFAQKIREAASQRRDEHIEPIIEFVDLLEPENIAARLRALGEDTDAVAIIAADHPLIAQAIQGLKVDGKPVVTYITDQSAPDRAGYVGTDNWKLGRTAAWFIAQTTQGPGRIAVFIGNHRYQCQDVADASFRSYIREKAGHLTVEDSRLTHEEAREAHRMVSGLLAEGDDLVGIYIAGGGISGVLQALREAPEEKRRSVRLVCRDIGPETRKGLAEGLITAALCHPLEQTSSQLVQTMIDAIGQKGSSTVLQRTVPFEIVTPESV